MAKKKKVLAKVEAERGNLHRAVSILQCAANSMEAGDGVESDDAPDYPDVIRIAIDIISKSAVRLDSVNL